MPYSQRFDPVDGVLIITLAGPVEGPEAVELQAQALLSQEPGARVILDVREQTTTPDTSRIRQFVEQFAESKNRPSHLAIVTSRDAMYGMVRMLAVFAEELGIRVTIHRDIASARRSVVGGPADD